MARRRRIDPSIWDDEDLGALSSDEFKLFVGCFSNADDEGKLEGSGRFLKGLVFRFRDGLRAERVVAWRDNIVARVRSFHLYESNSKTYIALLKWHVWQTIQKPQPSVIPDPPDAEFLDRPDWHVGVVHAQNQTKTKALQPQSRTGNTPVRPKPASTASTVQPVQYSQPKRARAHEAGPDRPTALALLVRSYRSVGVEMTSADEKTFLTQIAGAYHPDRVRQEAARLLEDAEKGVKFEKPPVALLLWRLKNGKGVDSD